MEKSRICNYICVVLMGVLLILQFMPFWNYNGMSSSIQSYVWLNTDNAELGSYLAGHVGDSYSINSIVPVAVLVLLLTVAGIVFCIWKSEIPFVSLIPLVCGLVGIWGYLSKPAMQVGTNWVLHLIVSIAMAVFAVLALVFNFKFND